MSKLRKPTSYFTMVPNALLRDKSISLKAKGIYALLYSKPDGWTYIEANLIEESNDGRESFRSGMKELAAEGWMTKEQVTDEHGRFSHNDLRLHDRKQKPDDVSTDDGKPVVGEPAPIKTEEVKRIEQDLVPPSGSSQRTKATTRESRGQTFSDFIANYRGPIWRGWPFDFLSFCTADLRWTEERALAVRELFEEYFTSADARRPVRKDWEATWRNWCRREAQRGGSSRQSYGHSGGSKMSAVASAVLADQMAGNGMAGRRGPGANRGEPDWCARGDDGDLPQLEGAAVGGGEG